MLNFKTSRFWISVLAIAFTIFATFSIYKFSNPNTVAKDEKNKIVRVGYLKLPTSLPLFTMIENGIAEKNKLKIELKEIKTSTEGINALLSGDIDIAFGQGIDPGVEAMSKSPDKFKILNYTLETEANPWNSIIIPENSQIKILNDLENKKVLVQSGGTAQKILISYLKEKGANIDKIQFVPLTFTQHLDVLSSGQADAAFTYEPNITTGAQKFNTKVLEPGIYSKLNYLHPGGNFISSDFIKNQSEAATNFARSLDQSIAYTETNNTDSRKYLQKYLGFDSILSEKIIIPRFIKPNDTSKEELQKYLDQSFKLGVLTRNISSKGYIYKP